MIVISTGSCGNRRSTQHTVTMKTNAAVSIGMY